MIFVFSEFSDIFKFAVEYIAESVQRVSAHVIVMPQSEYLTSAEVMITDQSILRIAFRFHCNPQFVVSNHIYTPFSFVRYYPYTDKTYQVALLLQKT